MSVQFRPLPPNTSRWPSWIRHRSSIATYMSSNLMRGSKIKGVVVEWLYGGLQIRVDTGSSPVGTSKIMESKPILDWEPPAKRVDWQRLSFEHSAFRQID